jgi:glycine/D-amino acid oxidase-like deaminating enzyme
VATNAWASKLTALQRTVLPVYSYVLLTEPLTDAQWESVGWEGRQGIEDKRNYIHYYRRTADSRILWGGSDAVVYPDLGISPRYDANTRVFGDLARTFRWTFPQLAAVRFSHRWGGPIALTAPFVPYFGSLEGGRVHYGVGCCGHGVAPSHLGGRILTDLLLKRDRGYSGLPLVQRRLAPFPPRLIAWPMGELIRKLLRKQDRDMDAGKIPADIASMLLRAVGRL